MESGSALQILGERIRTARKAKGLSQEQLALEAGIDRSFMGQVERGQRNVSFATLCRLAGVIQRDLGSLCEGLPQIAESLAETSPPYSGPKARQPKKQ